MTLKYTYGIQASIPAIASLGNTTLGLTSSTLDAANEELHCIGEVFLEAGSGSKTFSSSGGEIFWRTANATFANAGTTFRVGIQDGFDATGPVEGDGTFDVYRDYVGGTDSFSNNTAYIAAMSSGSISIAHGQKIVVGFKLVSRGGADSVAVSGSDLPINKSQYQIPSCVTNASGSFARIGMLPNVVIKFDDGTYGWLNGTYNYTASGSSFTYNSGTGTADEYGNLIDVKYPVLASGIICTAHPSSYSGDFELCLYSDPLGTPSIIEAISVDADQLPATNHGTLRALFSSVRSIKPGTYAVTLRPTTASNVTMYYHDVYAAIYNKFNGNEDCYAVNRLDNTGAFADYNGGGAKTRLLPIGLTVVGFDNGINNQASFNLGI